MKTRILKLCALTLLSGVFLFGLSLRWYWYRLPTGHPYPVPVIVPTKAMAPIYHAWQVAIVQPALWLWADCE